MFSFFFFMKQALVCAVQTVIFMIVTVWLYKVYPQFSEDLSPFIVVNSHTHRQFEGQ